MNADWESSRWRQPPSAGYEHDHNQQHPHPSRPLTSQVPVMDPYASAWNMGPKQRNHAVFPPNDAYPEASPYRTGAIPSGGGSGVILGDYGGQHPPNNNNHHALRSVPNVTTASARGLPSAPLTLRIPPAQGMCVCALLSSPFKSHLGQWKSYLQSARAWHFPR